MEQVWMTLTIKVVQQLCILCIFCNNQILSSMCKNQKIGKKKVHNSSLCFVVKFWVNVGRLELFGSLLMCVSVALGFFRHDTSTVQLFSEFVINSVQFPQNFQVNLRCKIYFKNNYVILFINNTVSLICPSYTSWVPVLCSGQQ